jgi:ABC-type nickel/cobalt efflux system permease component RcnA
MQPRLTGLTGRLLLLAGLLVALPVLALWATGSLGALAQWAAAGQRAAQEAMAGAVRAIRTGAPGAVWTLMGLCLAYGLFHAAGPGHGKVLIGGYGLARRVPFPRLAGLALAASFAQATVAVVMVGALVAALDWTRAQVVGTAEGAMVTAGHLAVAAVGLWLVWRGARGLARALQAPDAHAHHDHAHHGHPHDHHGHHHAHGETCNHAHGPSIEQAAAVTTWREAAALVGGIAVRPCSGALFLLIVTWQMGIFAAGVAGTYAMGLGTALVTLGVAGLSVWAREGALMTLAPRRLALALPALELAVGAAVVALSLTLAAA